MTESRRVRIELVERAWQDLDRIAEHLLAHEVQDVVVRIQAIVEACDILERHPRMGRPTADGLRELVIGRGARGYIALYDYDDTLEWVLVLAVKAQREAGDPDRD